MVEFLSATYQKVCFVYLSVLASDFLLIEVISHRLCLRMSTYATCVHIVFLWNIVCDAGVLGYVPECHGHVRVFLFKPIVESPPHNTHESSIP